MLIFTGGLKMKPEKSEFGFGDSKSILGEYEGEVWSNPTASASSSFSSPSNITRRAER